MKLDQISLIIQPVMHTYDTHYSITARGKKKGDYSPA